MMKKKIKVVTIIQARMGSTRLPGKVLMELGGVPALGRLVERVKRSILTDEIVIATSNLMEDSTIVEYALYELGVGAYRGDLEDVLKRVYECAKTYGADYIVDITGDCPLVDSRHIDILLSKTYPTQSAYNSNVWPIRTWPDGFDVQVYSFDCLEKTYTHLKDLPHNHVGWNIPELSQALGFFLLPGYPAGGVYNRPELGMTLDTPEDYDLLNKIFTHFGEDDFSAEKVINYVLREELYKINARVRRKTPEEG